MSKEDVTHRGIVERVEAGRLIVRTADERKCDGCAVVAICNSKTGEAEDTELLTIDCSNASEFSAGERVTLTATSSSTLLATWWALILPTLIFGGVILWTRLSFPAIGGWSIALGFVALGLYDLFLYLRRKKLAQRIRWEIRRVTD